MEQTGSNHINGLIRQAMDGNGTAFTALWDLYIDSLRSYVKRWLKNLDDLFVDDICSRSFEKAFRQIGSYDPDKSQFLTWLKVIAKNTALDLLEQEKRMSSLVISIDDTDKPVPVADVIQDQIDTPLESIIRGEDMDETRNCIERLPELYREVARKRLIEGLQYKEIAQELDMELNTVRTRIRRAKALIDNMRKENDDQE